MVMTEWLIRAIQWAGARPAEALGEHNAQRHLAEVVTWAKGAGGGVRAWVHIRTRTSTCLSANACVLTQRGPACRGQLLLEG